jgi:hypothetical protein
MPLYSMQNQYHVGRALPNPDSAPLDDGRRQPLLESRVPIAAPTQERGPHHEGNRDPLSEPTPVAVTTKSQCGDFGPSSRQRIQGRL